MTKYVVTGGAGFVGSHLCRALIERGDEVVSIDNYLSGSPRNHHAGVTYVDADAKDVALVGDAAGCDVVVHLGEYSRVEQSVREPFKAIENTYSQVGSVISFCHEVGAKMIYSASSTVAGDAQSPYALAKASNAALVKYICELTGIDYAITYFHNVYGKGENASSRYGTAVAKALLARKMGDEFLIHGDGNQIRYFTHVGDIVSGLLLVCDKGVGDGYGIGSDEPVSINQMVEAVGVNHRFVDSPAGNRTGGAVSTSKVRALGWAPRKDLMSYIKESIHDQEKD